MHFENADVAELVATKEVIRGTTADHLTWDIVTDKCSNKENSVLNSTVASTAPTVMIPWQIEVHQEQHHQH